jgi:ABC-2 type transport system permease protein
VTRRFPALVVANLKMQRRNRAAVFFALFFPLVFMVLFGLIFGGSESRQDLDVVGSGPLVRALERSGAVKLHVQPSAEQAIRRVRDGKVAGALIATAGGGTLWYDASSSISAAQLTGIVEGMASRLSLEATGRPAAVQVAARSVESSNLKYIDYLVPGLLAMALSQSAVFGVAAAMVSYRERGMFRRLRLTPLPLREFLSARVASQLVLALFQTFVLLSVGAAFFGVHVQNLGALVPMVIAGALCFITLGFFVGSFAKTQDAAAAVANVVTFPMVFLAGVFFPLTTAPTWLQAVARVLPLTYLADGLRDVAVRGKTLAQVWPDLIVLLGFTIVLATISLRTFRWEAT